MYNKPHLPIFFYRALNLMNPAEGSRERAYLITFINNYMLWFNVGFDNSEFFIYSHSTVPLPKDSLYFKRERKQAIDRMLAVSEY